MRQFVIWCAALIFLIFICSFDPHVLTHMADARIGRAKSDVRELSETVEAFKAKHGNYPETLKGLYDGGSLGHEFGNSLVDPWGHEYRYDSNGPRNEGKKPDIWTVTPDNKEIGNWPER